MSEDNENGQVAPDNEALVNSGESQSADSTVVAPSEDEQTTGSTDASTASEESKIVLTQEELDNKAAKIKAIAERRAKREYEAKLQQELGERQQQPNQQQQSAYAPEPQPSPDHVWDNVLGWIHKDTSREQYSTLVMQALNNVAQQPSSPQGVSNGQPVGTEMGTLPSSASSTYSRYGGLSPKTMDQIDECSVEFNDFLAVTGNVIKVDMANAAAMAPDGIKMLYELAKENPLEIYKISQLSPDEQKFRVWELQKERALKAQKIVNTRATPQPAPLESDGNVNNDLANKSFAQRKTLRLKESWDK